MTERTIYSYSWLFRILPGLAIGFACALVVINHDLIAGISQWLTKPYVPERDVLIRIGLFLFFFFGCGGYLQYVSCTLPNLEAGVGGLRIGRHGRLVSWDRIVQVDRETWLGFRGGPFDGTIIRLRDGEAVLVSDSIRGYQDFLRILDEYAMEGLAE